jgi:hypothetical protein
MSFVKAILEKKNSVDDLIHELLTNFDEDYYDIYAKYTVDPCKVLNELKKMKDLFITSYEKVRKKLKDADDYVGGEEFYEDVIDFFDMKCNEK